MKKLINLFKLMWKFVIEEPRERTDEEWEKYFAVAEVLKRHNERYRGYGRKRRWK